MKNAAVTEEKNYQFISYIMPERLHSSASALNDSYFISQPTSESAVYIENKAHTNPEGSKSDVDFSPAFKIINAYISGYSAAMKDFGIVNGESSDMTLDDKIEKLRDEIREDNKDISQKLSDMNEKLTEIKTSLSLKRSIFHYFLTAIIAIAAAWVSTHC